MKVDVSGSAEDSGAGGRRRRIAPIVLVAAVALCVLGGFAVFWARAATAVYVIQYGGEIVGVLPDAAAANALLEEFLATAQADCGRQVAPAGVLRVVRMPARDAPPPGEPEAIALALRETVGFLALAWAVTVDDEPVLVMASYEDAEQVLAEILARARVELEARAGTEVLQIGFREEVGIRQVTTHLEGFYGVEEAIRILLRGTDRVETYVVRRNDSLWGIASAHHLSVADLQRANPQLTNPNLIRPGDRLNLVVPHPYVHVQSLERHTFTRYIAFGRQTVLDPDRWPHESYVRDRGVPGRELVTVEIARVNGQEVSRRTLEVVPQAAPQPEVTVKGSRLYPRLGSGAFVWPVGGDGGRVTSGFGWRWGAFHQGVDIAAPYGTPVLAADAGTVTEVSYRGAQSYGWTVIIDHGEGTLVTLYAHLDPKIPVKPGQVVEKGQTIGYVGTSGRSTGPHLHFEVRVDGQAVNPLTYYPAGR